MDNSGNGRNELIIEATTRIAYRNGDWVMIPPYIGEEISKNVNIELGNSEYYKLYNLKNDPSQKINLSNKNSKKLEEMIDNFEIIIGKKFSYAKDFILE